MTTHMAPMAEEVYVRQPYEQTNTYGTNITPAAHTHNTVVLHQDAAYDRASIEAAELAAFEKGRMAGEMEAIRRHEANAPLKVMEPANAVVLAAPVAVDAPDVLEINRLTWLQRLAGLIGELSLLGTIALTAAWGQRWRNGYAWDNSQNNGEHRMLNGGILAFAIGLFFNAQAISNYRFLPIRMSANFGRAWYLFMQVCAGVCYSLAFAVVIMTYPTGETTFWRVDNWVFTFALATWAAHFFYSAFRTVLEHVWPVDYETWAEVNNNLDNTHNRLRLHNRGALSLDGKSAHGAAVDRRTVYAPAPRIVRTGRNIPAANANVGAQVPVAPANAPRWAETPRTHAENFFLLARSKWANVAYWSMGAAFLMLIAVTEVAMAAGRGSWSSGNGVNEPLTPLGLSSTQAHLVGALGVLTLAGLIGISYAAMPPRTTLVKNGGLPVTTGPIDNRRNSISHNAETIV